jgi:hypothetical protein
MNYVFTPQTFYIAQGDRLPPIGYVPMDGNGAPVPVAEGDPVVFSMRPQGGGAAVIDRAPAAVIAGDLGAPNYFQYAWADGDTATAGTFVAEFEWMNQGLPETFPNHDEAELWIRIRDDVA